MAATMKAAHRTSSRGGIEKNIQIKEVSTPTRSSKDTTLVKVDYSALNPVDHKVVEVPLVGRLITRVPGSDFAGTVVSSGHPDLKPGDAVFGMTDLPYFGTLAEYVLVKGRENVARIPDGVNPRDAAALGVAATTAYQSIVPFVAAGDKVLINGGSGGVGTFGIQIAKAIGCHVTTTCSGPNVELCENLGADNVIDYRSTNVVEHLKRQGTQYTLIFDTVGTPEIYYSAHHYLKPQGLFTAIAVDPTSFLSIRKTILMFLLPAFLGGGQRPLKLIGAHPDPAVFDRLVQWLKEGTLKTQIDGEYRLDQTGEAFARLKTGRTRGKIVIKVRDG